MVGRSVRGILAGWSVFGGYMWPCVMLSYFVAPLIVGLAFHPGARTPRAGADNGPRTVG